MGRQDLALALAIANTAAKAVEYTHRHAVELLDRLPMVMSAAQIAR